MESRRVMWIAGLILWLAALFLSGCQSQTESGPPFYFGVDLSYVNEMDDCGAVYLENGQAQDPFQLFSNHGANLVRARLWHNPDWTDYSILVDVERTFERAQAAGMATLLDFHYSDNWADPSKQAIPAAWENLAEDELPQAVYQYTYDVLTELHEKGLMPDFVQVGNETNSGMLKRVMELDWPRDAKLFNAGLRAVRDVAAEAETNPKIILHVAQPENAGWWFREARENGITDFDIIGLSYYPQWSTFSISDVGAHVTYLRQEFGKDAMIVETAYPWTFEAVNETADNILNQGVRGYPITIEGQRQFMIDLTQSLISNGGLGVVYWEPAWVSTDCSTRWGQGSHWENATFFDFQNGNEVHQGIDFLNYAYLFPADWADGLLDESYGEPLLQDDAGDNLDQVPHLDLLNLHARDDTDSIYLGLTMAGDIYANPWGSYMIYFDTTQDGQGADIDVDKRPITMADPYQPEFRLDIRAIDRKGTVSGSYEFYAWDGAEWQALALAGGAAIQNGHPSVIELQIPKALLGNPEFINLGVVSTGRGRIHTAGDIMGIDISPSDWEEPVTLDVFAQYVATNSP
jgi:arabinogalactan endo-1,4-beta-galactosidase